MPRLQISANLRVLHLKEKAPAARFGVVLLCDPVSVQKHYKISSICWSALRTYPGRPMRGALGRDGFLMVATGAAFRR